MSRTPHTCDSCGVYVKPNCGVMTIHRIAGTIKIKVGMVCQGCSTVWGKQP